MIAPGMIKVADFACNDDTYPMVASINESGGLENMMGMLGALLIGMLIQIFTSALTWMRARSNERKLKALHGTVSVVNTKVDQVEVKQVEAARSIDGLLERLIRAVEFAAHAKGVSEGVAEEKKRTEDAK
jgi:hypothetical protein